MYINYKHVANMKGTINGSRQPRGTQVKKGCEPLLCVDCHDLREVFLESIKQTVT